MFGSSRKWLVSRACSIPETVKESHVSLLAVWKNLVQASELWIYKKWLKRLKSTSVEFFTSCDKTFIFFSLLALRLVLRIPCYIVSSNSQLHLWLNILMYTIKQVVYFDQLQVGETLFPTWSIKLHSPTEGDAHPLKLWWRCNSSC